MDWCGRAGGRAGGRVRACARVCARVWCCVLYLCAHVLMTMLIHGVLVAPAFRSVQTLPVTNKEKTMTLSHYKQEQRCIAYRWRVSPIRGSPHLAGERRGRGRGCVRQRHYRVHGGAIPHL